MRKLVVMTVSTLGYLLVTGCTPPVNRVAMTEESRSQIKQIDNHVIVSQKKVKPTYSKPQLYYSIDPIMLASAMVVNGIMVTAAKVENNKQDKLVKPLLAKVKQHEFTQDFQLALNQELNKSKIFGSKSIKFDIKEVKASNLYLNDNNELKNIPLGQAVLDIPTEYTMSPNYDVLDIVAKPKIMLKTKNNKLVKIYSNDISYIGTLKNNSKKAEANIDKWVANNGKLIHLALRDAAKMIAKELVMDLKASDNKTVMQGKIEQVNNRNTFIKKGIYLENSKQQQIARMQDGSLYVNQNLVG